MRTVDIVIWVLFLSACLFLGYFFMKRMKKTQEMRAKVQAEYKMKKEKYKYLTKEVLDTCPQKDLTTAVVIHCMRKEDEDFEHYFDNFTKGEKIIYGIYQIGLSLQGRGASLHSFFLSPSNKPYIPICDEIFNEVGAYDLAQLMKAARRFAEIIENDEQDDEDDPEMGDYSRYNFSDFTNEYATLVSTTNLADKLTDYISEHKEDFYDEDILEEGVKDNEGISSEI